MTEADAKRVEELLNAELTYDAAVEEKYGEASHRRMRELKELLLWARFARASDR